MKPEERFHCISCEFFKDHVYDKLFLNHECYRYSEEDDSENQIDYEHCPECGCQLINDENSGEDYCPGCGLITTGSYSYVAGVKINYPYGLQL